ncbi:alpha/beta hydrolase fold domain-containing protein [Rhodobacterales bacterium FZCC0188]|jgi:arylformamidase|nr:alpha/beta hydrolase fold domain-containing protein [Rhodobacterales bacterium FZCC0188]
MVKITDFDDAYQNGAYIPDADGFITRWTEAAASFRAAYPPVTHHYGTGPRQYFDLFMPDGAPKGLTIFIHGGYWRRFSPREFSHLARALRDAGQAVALPSYTLAPEARIAQITDEMMRAVCHAAGLVEGPIRITGHSAGGHLAARMMCEGVLPDTVAARVVQVMSISGVHDLRPLLNTEINQDLRLTLEEAMRESPALLLPRKTARFVAVVGGDERPEFIRQNDLLANIWHGAGVEIEAMHLAGLHHFDVIEELERPDGRLLQQILAD